MMRRKPVVDLKTSYQGSFLVEAGDIALTNGDDLVMRTIGLRLRTPTSGQLWPGIGITRFAGLRNDSSIREEMRNAVERGLTKDGFLNAVTVSVGGNDKEAVDLNIYAPGGNTSLNVFSFNSGIVSSMTEDTSAATDYQTDNSATKDVTNKYLLRNL
jgi:hypothetical protein